MAGYVQGHNTKGKETFVVGERMSGRLTTRVLLVVLLSRGRAWELPLQTLLSSVKWGFCFVVCFQCPRLSAASWLFLLSFYSLMSEALPVYKWQCRRMMSYPSVTSGLSDGARQSSQRLSDKFIFSRTWIRIRLWCYKNSYFGGEAHQILFCESKGTSRKKTTKFFPLPLS